jgi:ABC-type branched-subunit amino acid transport system ATPase component
MKRIKLLFKNQSFDLISGAGKTTLMNILTHRRPGKLSIVADVRINGRKMKKDISGISAFVQQEELFIGSLTVREHLRFHVFIHFHKIICLFSFYSLCFVLEKNLRKMNELNVLMKFFILYVITFENTFKLEIFFNSSLI